MVDGIERPSHEVAWAAIWLAWKTACGAGWQVLATEFRRRGTIPCGHMSFLIAIQLRSVQALNFRARSQHFGPRQGANERRGRRNRENGTYEAFRWRWLVISSTLLGALRRTQRIRPPVRRARCMLPCAQRRRRSTRADNTQADSFARHSLTMLMFDTLVTDGRQRTH